MKKDDILYGLEGWETLEDDPDVVLERIFDEVCVEVGEPFDVIADRLDWPIQVFEYKRMGLPEGLAEDITGDVLNKVLDDLDCDYGNPDEDSTKPTEAMREAALAFAKIVVAEYVPWTCEPTGEIDEYTREQAKGVFGDFGDNC